eukprot:58809-Prymnesium_polylepis.2
MGTAWAKRRRGGVEGGGARVGEACSVDVAPDGHANDHDAVALGVARKVQVLHRERASTARVRMTTVGMERVGMERMGMERVGVERGGGYGRTSGDAGEGMRSVTPGGARRDAQRGCGPHAVGRGGAARCGGAHHAEHEDQLARRAGRARLALLWDVDLSGILQPDAPVVDKLALVERVQRREPRRRRPRERLEAKLLAVDPPQALAGAVEAGRRAVVEVGRGVLWQHVRERLRRAAAGTCSRDARQNFSGRPVAACQGKRHGCGVAQARLARGALAWSLTSLSWAAGSVISSA